MNTKGLSYFKHVSGRLMALVIMLTTLAACDSSTGVGGLDAAESFSIDDTVMSIALDLGLSAEETAVLSASFAKFGDGSLDGDKAPGFLWHVAAELHATLSEEQRARLFERLERAGDQRHRGGQGVQQQHSRRGGPSMGGQNGPRGNALEQLGLSDEQKEAIKTIREAYKLQIEAILAQRETLTRAEIKEQLNALQETIKSEIEDVFTDEQKAQLEQLKADAEARRAEREASMQANREAAREVMIEVLGLTDDQVTHLMALRESAKAERDAIRELIESGTDRETVEAQVEARREAHEAAFASIYDDTQYEIVRIHQAISMRLKTKKRQHGQGGQSIRPGQGGRNGGPGSGGQR